MDEFYDLRLEYYDKRKQYLISKIYRDVEILKNKVEFILAVIAGHLKIQNVKKSAIIADLIRLGFK